MPNATDRDADPQKQPGFAPGKRVWFKTDFDGARLSRELGPLAQDMKVLRADALYVTVVLSDKTERRFYLDRLRLTPPPALSGKNAKVVTKEPKPRKEAIKPEYGTETTIFDVLEG